MIPRSLLHSLLTLALLVGAVGLLAPDVADAADAPKPTTEKVVRSGELHLPLVAPGEAIQLHKVLDETGRPQITSPSPLVDDPSDLERLRTAEVVAMRARFGNLGPLLRESFETMGPTDLVTVRVHPRRPYVTHPNKYETDLASLEAHSRGLAAAERSLDTVGILSRYLKATPAPRPGVAPGEAVVMEVDRATLALLRFDPQVEAVQLYRPPKPTSWPIQEIVDSAYNPAPLPSNAKGSGVNTATFEIGIHPTNASCWNLGPPDVVLNSNQDRYSHSNSVFALLVNGAPDATHHHFVGSSLSTTAAQHTVTHGLQTISMSYENWGTANSTDQRRMDDFAYQWPFPVFTNPTANDGYQYEAHWQQYNGISVGNVRHTSNLYYELAGSTQTRNPDPYYGPTLPGTPAGDREMPHIVSPGHTPYPSDGGAIDPCAGWFPIWNGTSFSAPLANAMAANVISSDSRMVNKPELVKAVLLATAKNVDRGEWDSTEDGRDGAGVVSAKEAVWLAQNGTTVPENGQAEYGLGHGSLNAADEGRELVFDVKVPSTKPAGRHLRAVLVWTSNPDQVNDVNSLSDLDLTLGDKTTGIFGGSYSLDDNVEIIDVPREDLVAGSTIPLRVQVTDTRIPAGATASYFYYAVAWAWVQDFYFHAPVYDGYRVGMAPPYYCADDQLGSLDEETAERFCRERGYTGHVRYVLSQESGVHTWWNGSSWSVSGNSLVCYLENLLCESTRQVGIGAVQ